MEKGEEVGFFEGFDILYNSTLKDVYAGKADVRNELILMIFD